MAFRYLDKTLRDDLAASRQTFAARSGGIVNRVVGSAVLALALATGLPQGEVLAAGPERVSIFEWNVPARYGEKRDAHGSSRRRQRAQRACGEGCCATEEEMIEHGDPGDCASLRSGL
jgi:hypothetical protein